MRLLTAIAFLSLVTRGTGFAARPPAEWRVVPLVSNSVLAVDLKYMTPASAADEDWMILEIANLTDAPLRVDQVGFNLDGERRDALTGRLRSSGGLTAASTVFLRGVVTSGVAQVSSKVWKGVSCNLSAAPRTGLRIVARARVSIITDKGYFGSPACSLEFDWRYPDAEEIPAITARLHRLLAAPVYRVEHCWELYTLFGVEEAAADLTADEMLEALKARQGSVDGRHMLCRELGQRFPHDSNVVSFIRERLVNGDLSDVQNGIWNPVFVPLLVENFEETGSHSALATVLAPHREDWAADTQVVARLAAALVKHRPLLTAEVSQLSTNVLFAWGRCVREAGMIGDRGLLPILAPALDDHRMALAPGDESRMSIRPDRLRVSDYALEAIAATLGIPVRADYRLHMDESGLEPLADCRRAIADMKKRLAALETLRQRERATRGSQPAPSGTP